MKRRILTGILAMALLFTLAPFAFAEDAADPADNTADVQDEQTVTDNNEATDNETTGDEVTGDETTGDTQDDANTDTATGTDTDTTPVDVPEPVPTMDNFQRIQTYTAGQFIDVAATAWYANNVKDAYEYGLMGGTGANYFNAEGNLTIAEAITMATRLHSIYMTGETLALDATTTWYAPYVDYAKTNGIVVADYADYNAAATRAQFADIFSRALPADVLPAYNTVADDAIPDVKMTDEYASAIYMLYRAGILGGTDAQGSFTPNANIQRNAAAAIVARMADPTTRIGYVAPEPEPETVYYEAYASVPDFGALFEVTANTDTEEGTFAYAAATLPEDALTQYQNLLVAEGFTQVSDETVEEVTTYVYENDEYTVTIGFNADNTTFTVVITAKAAAETYEGTEVVTYTAVTEAALVSSEEIQADVERTAYKYAYDEAEMAEYITALEAAGFEEATVPSELDTENMSDTAAYQKDDVLVIVSHYTVDDVDQVWVIL